MSAWTAGNVKYHSRMFYDICVSVSGLTCSYMTVFKTRRRGFACCLFSSYHACDHTVTWGTFDHNEESTVCLPLWSRSLFTPLWSDDTFDSSKLVCMQQNNKLKLSLSCRTLQQRSHQAIKWIALSVLGCLRHLLSNHLHHTWEPLRFPNPFAFSLPHVRSIVGGYGAFVVNRALSL